MAGTAPRTCSATVRTTTMTTSYRTKMMASCGARACSWIRRMRQASTPVRGVLDPRQVEVEGLVPSRRSRAHPTTAAVGVDGRVGRGATATATRSVTPPVPPADAARAARWPVAHARSATPTAPPPPTAAGLVWGGDYWQGGTAESPAGRRCVARARSRGRACPPRTRAPRWRWRGSTASCLPEAGDVRAREHSNRYTLARAVRSSPSPRGAAAGPCGPRRARRPSPRRGRRRAPSAR